MLMREPEAGLVLCAALLSSAGGMDVDLPANTEWELLYTYTVYQVNSAAHMGSIQENVHYPITI